MIAEIKGITETKDMKRPHDKREGANFFYTENYVQFL